MRKYEDVLLNSATGLPISGGTVTVRVANASPGTGALASIYSDNGITLVGGSVVTTSAVGRFSFYAPDGRYDLTFTGTGFTTYIVADVELADVIQGSSGDSGWKVKTLNNIRFADQFASLAAAIADLPSNGGIVIVPSGYRETITSTVNVGADSTQRVIVHMMPDSKITCNITNNTDCFIVHNGSGFVAENVGYNSGAGAGILELASTASVRSVITTGEGGVAGGQGFFILNKVFIRGHASATVSLAMVNIEGVLNQASLHDFYVGQFANTIGLLLRNNSTSNTLGPLVLDNVWVDGNALAGARPLVIQWTGTGSIINIQVMGGTYNHPGNGMPCIEVNGNSNADTMRNITLSTYVEDLVNNNAIGYKLVDCGNLTILTSEAQLSGTGAIGIDISQTAAGRVKSLHVRGFKTTGATVTAVNNHITGETIGSSSLYLTDYTYGTDGTGTGQVGPVWSNLNSFILGKHNATAQGLADVVIVASAPASKRPLVIRNFADNSMNVDLDAGSAAAQNVGLRYTDRNASIWEAQKTSGNAYIIRDSVNAINRLALNQSGAASTTGALKLQNAELVGWRNNANNANLTAGYNATDQYALTNLVDTGASSQVKRLKASQGTSLVAGDFALSAGWGTTATVTAVVGTDQGWQITVTSSGTGQAANPTITLTFKDGTWTSAPICVSKMAGGTGTITQFTEAPTATTNVLTFNGTPVAASTYIISSIAMGR